MYFSTIPRRSIIWHYGSLWLLLVVLGATACKNNKKNTASTPLPTSAELLSGKIADNELPAEWLSATLNINANDGSRSQSFAADMRWHKNKAIWLSVYPNIGIKIEVARALVTPDSVQVIDRFNKQYHAHSIQYLRQLIGYPIDFNTLQRIMSGGRLLTPDTPTHTDTLPNAFVLMTDRENLHETIELNRNDFTAAKISLHDAQTAQQLDIILNNYQPVGDRAFAHQRNIAVQSPKGSYNAEVLFSSVTPHNTALEMPFNVGNKYKRQ